MSALARKIGIAPAQLFDWRSEGLKPGEVEKRDDDARLVSAVRSERGMIKIVVNDTVVQVGIDVGEAHLRG